MRGEFAESLRANREALKLARDEGSAELEAQSLSGLADAEYLRARMISANDYFHKCIELARAEGFGRIVASNPHCTTLLLRARASDGLNDSILQMESSRVPPSSRHSHAHAIVSP
jgi:hypothetical protein